VAEVCWIVDSEKQSAEDGEEVHDQEKQHDDVHH
jgi:hypothetical protein